MASPSSDVTTAFALQVDASTTATGAYTELLSTDATITTAFETITDGEQGASRIQDADGIGRQTNTASITANFREDTMDIFFRSAFAGDFVDNAGVDELFVAKNPVYLTLVQQTPFLAAGNQFEVYTGFVVSSIAMSFPQDGYIGVQIELSGGSKTTPATAPWTVLNPAAAKNKLRTCTALTSLQVATQTANALTEVGSIVPTFDWQISNETTDLFDVRQCDAAESSLGPATVSGNINAYLDDESHAWGIDSQANETAKLLAEWRGETKTYKLSVPFMVNNAAKDGSGTDVVQNMPWGAINGTTLPFLSKETT